MMNRRVFLKDLGLKTIGLSGVIFSLNMLYGKSSEKLKLKNWIWIPSESDISDDEWKRKFEAFKNAGIDAILPEIYKGRPAYFGSKRLPVEAEFLEQLIPIAKSCQLEIHTWMWTMPCMLEDIQTKHPDWYTVNRLGDSSVDKPAYVPHYKFLCPTNEGVHEFIQGTVGELVQYDVDGIHLDFIRYPDVILPKGRWARYNLVQDKEYPQFDYCYCPICRKKFKEQEGIDPMEIEDPSTNQAWLQFRYDQVTKLVNNKLIPIARNANKMITAAVFPIWRNVRQEWRAWNLDAVFPMLYNRMYEEDAEWIKYHCQEGVKSLRYDTKLYSGIMIDEPEKFKEYIIKSIEGNANGISVFSSRRLGEEHLEVLAQVLKM